MTVMKELHHYQLALAAPETEFSLPFVKGMANRMAVSFHKYGCLADPEARTIDYLASLQQRLNMYQETGNTEYLIDAANFAMIEYMYPKHVTAHFQPTDSDGSPGRTRTDGSVDAERNAKVVSTVVDL